MHLQFTHYEVHHITFPKFLTITGNQSKDGIDFHFKHSTDFEFITKIELGRTRIEFWIEPESKDEHLLLYFDPDVDPMVFYWEHGDEDGESFKALVESYLGPLSNFA